MKPLEKVNRIGDGDISALKAAYNAYTYHAEVIQDRVNYILRKTAEIFGGKIEWWDWSNGAGEADGHFEPSFLRDKCINVDGETKGGGDDGDWVAILKNDEEWELRLEFPIRWLTEDFEQELIAGIEKYKDKKLKRKETEKQKKLAREINKQKLVNAAKAKLTKEELAAIKNS